MTQNPNWVEANWRPLEYSWGSDMVGAEVQSSKWVGLARHRRLFFTFQLVQRIGPKGDNAYWTEWYWLWCKNKFSPTSYILLGTYVKLYKNIFNKLNSIPVAAHRQVCRFRLVISQLRVQCQSPLLAGTCSVCDGVS